MEIRNMNELSDALTPYITEAMEKTRIYVKDKIEDVIYAYYTEEVFEHPKGKTSEPKEYKRTGRLGTSFDAGQVRRTKRNWYFKVGWPNSYLKFKYEGANGFQVLTWFNTASHGGNVEGEHMFWEEALANMGGEEGIRNRFFGELKATGLPMGR